jgi:hypothetical protein
VVLGKNLEDECLCQDEDSHDSVDDEHRAAVKEEIKKLNIKAF